eukprot:7172201-Prymnesium_polylepis.1
MSEYGASDRVWSDGLISPTLGQEPERVYAVRSAILAHLSGSGRYRDLCISPWRALHAPGLVTGIHIELISRLYLARSHSDLHHMISREIQPRSQFDANACNETVSVQRLPRTYPYCPGSSRTDRVSENGASDGVRSDRLQSSRSLKRLETPSTRSEVPFSLTRSIRDDPGQSGYVRG